MSQTSASNRRAEKSAAAFRTISEVAGELDVQQHVLRFWETKFNQVRPLKRGGGRRYYRPEDVQLLKRIRGLLYDDGYTIKGVQRLLREGSLKPETIASVKRAHIIRPVDSAGQGAAPTLPHNGGGRSTPTLAPTPAPGVPAPESEAPESKAAPAAARGAEPEADDMLRGELREILTELKALRAMLPHRSS